MKIPSRKTVTGTFGYEELDALDKRTLHAVLATSNNDRPYTSLVSYAYDPKMRVFVFLTPKKTTKYANIRKNGNVSLLIDTRNNSRGDYMGAKAYTVQGKAKSLRQGRKKDMMLEAFLFKHPGLDSFSRDKDVALVTISIEFCMKVGRFQEVLFLAHGQNKP